VKLSTPEVAAPGDGADRRSIFRRGSVAAPTATAKGVYEIHAIARDNAREQRVVLKRDELVPAHVRNGPVAHRVQAARRAGKERRDTARGLLRSARKEAASPNKCPIRGR